MTGWRLWTVRTAHAGAIAALSLRWASSGEYGFGIAAGGFAIGLAVTFLPGSHKGRRT